MTGSDTTSAVDSGWRRWSPTVLCALVALLVTAQNLALDRVAIYVLFRQSSADLLAHRDVYAATHGSFRYSPTFALLFAPLAALPLWLGAALWSLVNALALAVALTLLLPPRQSALVQLLVLGDLVRSLQNSQSNALVAGLMVLAFVAYEREKSLGGALAAVGGGLVKIFPAGSALFALLRPARRRHLVTLLAVSAALVLLPAAVVGPRALLALYHSWFHHEQGQVFKPMYSLMDLVDAWTGTYWRRWPFQLAGLVLLLLPLALRRDAWDDAAFRRGVLWSVLVFVVLFNHGAESPSYVIALTGIAGWYAMGPRSRTAGVVLVLALLLDTVGSSDLTPRVLRDTVLSPSRARVVPLLLAFALMQWELWRWRRAPSGGAEVGEREVALRQA